MQLRYTFRLYPLPGQERALARAFGCARVVFNDAVQAYRFFFDSAKGRRAGRRVGRPRFRSRRDSRQTIRFTRTHFVIKPNGCLRLARVGEIKVRWSRSLPAQPSSVTVIRDSAGRFFASFVVDIAPRKALPTLDSEIGLDLGLCAYAVDSRGRVIANPRFLRNHERRLKKVAAGVVS